MNYISETEINNYMKRNSKYFENSQISLFKNLIANSNMTLEELDTFKFKSPALGRLLSVFGGWLGLDRFYSGNYLLGALKLFTSGGLGIWWVIDWFLIGNKIKESNQTEFNNFLSGESTTSFAINADNLKNIAKSEEMRQATKTILKSTKNALNSLTDDLY